MWKTRLTILAMLWLSDSAIAAIPGGTVMNFSGRIFRPACEFNQGQTIDIDFEKVGFKKVDGTRYAKTTVLRMNCPGSEGKQLKLQFYRADGAGSAEVLNTNNPNLGIVFRDTATGKNIVFNTFFNVTDKTGYSFTAVPVKKRASEPLELGPFSAVATIVSSYF